MTRRKSAWDPGATFDRNDKNQDFIVYPQGTAMAVYVDGSGGHPAGAARGVTPHGLRHGSHTRELHTSNR